MVMGLPAKVFELWRRLGVRFLIEDSPPGGGATVATTVQPVTDADKLLLVQRIDTLDVTFVATGTQTIRTVPAGKRWKLYNVNVQALTGDRDIDSIKIREPGGGEITLATGSATSLDTDLLVQVLTLDEAWLIQIVLSGGTTDGDKRFTAYIEEEDAY